MSAAAEDTDAIMAQCKRWRVANFLDERDTTLAALRSVNRAANDAMNSVPEKFHAPLLALMTIAQDAEKKLLSGKQPRAYWIGDEAEALKYFRTTERLASGLPVWKA